MRSFVLTLFLFLLAGATALWGAVTLPLRCILVAGLALCAAPVLRNPPGMPGAVRWLLAGLWMACLLGLHFRGNGTAGQAVFLLQAICLLSFYVGCFLCGDRSGRRMLLLGIAALGLVAVAFGFVQQHLGVEHVLGRPIPPQYLGRMTGLFLAPNLFAALALITTILCYGRYKGSESLRERIGWGIPAGVAALAIILSGSRLALLLLAFFLVFAVWRQSRRVRAALLLTGLALAGISLGLGTGSVERLRGAWDEGMQTRAMVWQDTARLIAQDPWTGHGLGNFRYAYPRVQTAGISRRVDFAHSDLLHGVAEQGILGMALWLGLIGFSIASSLRNHSEEAGAMRYAALAVFILALFDFPLQSPAIAAMAFAMLGGCAVVERKSKRFSRVVSWTWTFLLAGLVLAAWHTGMGQWHVAKATQARRALDWPEALRHYWEGVQWDSGNGEAWRSMGEIHLARHRFGAVREEGREDAKKAEEFFRQAISVNPMDAKAWLGLGMLAIAQGDLGLAARHIAEALRLEPHNGVYHDAMAQCQLRQGNKAVAKGHLDMALWLYPRDETARQLRKDLGDE